MAPTMAEKNGRSRRAQRMRTPRVSRKRVIFFQGGASRLSCMRLSLRGSVRCGDLGLDMRFAEENEELGLGVWGDRLLWTRTEYKILALRRNSWCVDSSCHDFRNWRLCLLLRLVVLSQDRRRTSRSRL